MMIAAVVEIVFGTVQLHNEPKEPVRYNDIKSRFSFITVEAFLVENSIFSMLISLL
jgi:hypothetical protein